jgi:hypothetical protein
MAELRNRRDGSSRRFPGGQGAPIGAVVGFTSLCLAFDAVDRYGASTVYPATVEWIGRVPASRPGYPDRYGFAAETDSGQLVRSIDQDLYHDLEHGQRISVTISDFTGTPIAVDAAGRHYDLLAHPEVPEALAIVLIAAVALLVVVVLRSATPWKVLGWGIIGALAGFALPPFWTWAL